MSSTKTIRTLPYDSQQQLGSNVMILHKTISKHSANFEQSMLKLVFFTICWRLSQISHSRPETLRRYALAQNMMDLQNSSGTLRAHKKWNVPHGHGKCVSCTPFIPVAHPDQLANAALCISGEEKTCVCPPIAIRQMLCLAL